MLFRDQASMIAIVIFNVFCSPAYALNIATLLKGIADDVTVVYADGVCSANRFHNDPPCLAAKATCPVGKIPMPVNKAATCSPLNKFVDFDINRVNVVSPTTKVATGSVECSPKSQEYYDKPTETYIFSYPGYIPHSAMSKQKSANHLITVLPLAALRLHKWAYLTNSASS